MKLRIYPFYMLKETINYPGNTITNLLVLIFRSVKRIPILLFILFCLHFLTAIGTPVSDSDGTLKVTVYGAAEQVSGSLTLIEANNKRFLIDCGLFYPAAANATYKERQQIANKKNEDLPIDPQSIDAVFVTHSHLDHIGRIPLLIEKGFIGKIYCTKATKEILKEMLLSQIRYDNRDRNWSFSESRIKKGFSGNLYVTAHWNNCQWTKNIKSSNLLSYIGHRTDAEDKFKVEFSPCKFCANKTLETVIPYVESVDLNSSFVIDSKTKITFLYAGHIPGSASILMEIIWKEGITKKLLFSGDLGNSVGLLQNGPVPAPKVDAVWVETTYGGIQRQIDVAQELSNFERDIAEALMNGGIAWIPAFALDRTQKILYAVSRAKQRGIIPQNTPVFCPSPTADYITGLYQEEICNNQKWFKPGIYQETDAFAVYFTTLPEDIPRSSILITTSGMIDAAFSAMLSKKLLPDPATTVFLVGYQDPGTPGGQLKKQQRTIEWDGETINVNAKVNDYKVFTAHPDALELVQWLSNQDKNSTKIFLVHGDQLMLNSQKSILEKAGFLFVKIPKEKEILDFSLGIK